jgi:hypothetical protein
MKERRSLAMVFLLLAVIFFIADLFINYRVYFQLNGGGAEILMTRTFGALSQVFVMLGDIAGVAYSTCFLRAYSVILVFLYTLQVPLGENERPATHRTVLLAVFSTALFFLTLWLSPVSHVMFARDGFLLHVYWYFMLNVTCIALVILFFSRIGKTLMSRFSDNMAEGIHADPFGRNDRVFHQQTEKLENDTSVNIPYFFTGIDLKQKRGWINFINIFRGNVVLGVPGSGKSYAFFLPAIQQLIEKGFSMVVYDFKFHALTKYTYNCLLTSSAHLLKVNGIEPQFTIISLENPLYSQRCNVFQPHLLNDFTVDAYGLAKAFMIALNPSWKNKEGDFFPESATNLVAAAAWGLKIYQNGKYCSLPHLIEFLSQDTDSVVTMLINLKDNSLRNVVRPFEEAKQDGAMEQLQGQMGTVRIALSRLTSPKMYFMLTEEDDREAFNLQINSRSSPKILCLANSGQNQGVNNVVLSLFVVQIFRFINKEKQMPCAVMLDEAVTLSYPKGTLDTLIATGRSNRISVWLGFQDLSQMVRDMGRDVAESIFKMIGNTVAGLVNDDTAERISKRIGKMKIMKRSTSVSAEGDVSVSYQEQFDTAVPDSFISSMSQGTFAGTLADNFDQKMSMKAFYGEVDFKDPFRDTGMKDLPYSDYWTDILKRECDGWTPEQIDTFVEQKMDLNFQKVVKEVEMMKEQLLAQSGL